MVKKCSISLLMESSCIHPASAVRRACEEGAVHPVVPPWPEYLFRGMRRSEFGTGVGKAFQGGAWVC